MISLLSAGQSSAPVFNPIPFVVSSTNSASANFKFVCDVYVSGVTGFTRLLLSPNPTSGTAAFLVNEVLRSRVTSDFETATGTTVNPFMECDNSHVLYELKFGEQFGATGSIVTYANLLISSTQRAYNGSLDTQDWLNYSGTDYILLNSTRKFLQKDKNFNNYPIRITDQAWLHYACTTSNTDKFLQISTYDATNTLIQNIVLINQYTNKSTFKLFQRASVGPVDLNLVDASFINTGTQPFITSSVKYYTINIANVGGVQTSEMMTYFIDKECTNSEEFRLYFKNNYGGFDTFSFYKKSKRIADIKRKMYQKNVGGLNTTTNQWEYLSTDAGEVVMDTQISNKYILNSDWIGNDIAKWLKQLATSPEVYIFDPDLAVHIRVNIKATSYETKKIDNEKMFSMTLEVEASQQSYRQQQ